MKINFKIICVEEYSIMMLRSRQVLTKAFQKVHFHSKSKAVVISDHVQNAIANGDPIVALESTIITHGMPRPHNLNTAKRVEAIIREKVHYGSS